MDAHPLLTPESFDPDGEVPAGLVDSITRDFLDTADTRPIGLVPIALQYFKGEGDQAVHLVRMLKLTLDPKAFRLVCGAILTLSPFAIVAKGRAGGGESMN